MHPFLILPIALSAVLTVALGYTLVTGGRQADIGKQHPHHVLGANWTIGLTLAVGLSMGVAHWVGALPPANPTVLKVHLGCIVAYMILILVMRFIITGVHHRFIHIGLGCLLAPTYVILAIAGSILLGQAVFAASS
jgi:hypothetical protein